MITHFLILIDSETGFIGGEPEDQLFCRDCDCVVPLLNKISKETTPQKISQEMLCQQVVDILNSKDSEISREMVDKLFRAVMKKFSDPVDPVDSVDPVYPWEI